MKYYIARNGVPAGPFELWQLRYEDVSGDTLVWHNGLDGWTKASEIPELYEVLSGYQVPPPFDPENYEAKLRGENRMFYGNGGDHFYPRPNNYLAEAIVVTLLCSPITGIVAIVKSSKVNTLYNEHRYEEAERKSIEARNWVIGSIIFGIFGVSMLLF